VSEASFFTFLRRKKLFSLLMWEVQGWAFHSRVRHQ
jgi:hypothetical protein